MRKGLVVANCQARGLASLLSLFCKNLTFDALQVHVMDENKTKRFITDQAKNFDVVCAFRLSKNFWQLQEDSIRASFPASRVLFISNLYFAGLHPDQTYVGGLSGRCVGALGDYHSKLALLAFMAGRSIAEADALFSSETFRILGFYDDYKISRSRWFEQDARSDVKIAEELFALMPSVPTLFSANHPTTIYFYLYAQKIARHLAQLGDAEVHDLPWDPLIYQNFLADGPIFPVYPEIAQHHEFGFGGSYFYKTVATDRQQARFMDRLTFLKDEFAAFESFGRSNIEQTSHWLSIRDHATRQKFTI